MDNRDKSRVVMRAPHEGWWSSRGMVGRRLSLLHVARQGILHYLHDIDVLFSIHVEQLGHSRFCTRFCPCI